MLCYQLEIIIVGPRQTDHVFTNSKPNMNGPAEKYEIWRFQSNVGWKKIDSVTEEFTALPITLLIGQ